MDVAGLAKLFSTTFDPNPNVRKAGELEIRQAARQEGMLTAVIQIVGSNEMDVPIRQAACIYLKNRVHKCWDTSAVTKKRADYFEIAQSERDALRASIFPLIIASPSQNITIQLTTTLRNVIADDFPEKWPDMMNTIKALLNSNDTKEVMAGCTAVLEVVKVFRYRQASDVLAHMAGEIFPQLATIAAHLLNTPLSGPSQDIPTILHTILKSYRNSIVLQLSKHQQSPESIVPWGRLLFQVINVQIPAEAVPQDEDEREKCEWWKAKKWAYSVLGRLFHRYGNPSQLPTAMKEDYGAFADHFISSFAPEIIKTYLHQVELLVSGQTWLSKKCQYQILQFLTECVKPKATWALIKPHAQTLVQSFVFPQMSFTAKKQELWESDPVEYTRTCIDQYEDFADPVSAATSFLYSLASNRTKATFLPILGFISSVLESNADAPQKYGALSMVSALHHFMLRHPAVRPNVEQFVVQHVFPCFNSSFPYLRAIAYEIIADVEKLKIKWTDENLKTVSQAVGNALSDPELPVRVQAALALTELIQTHPSVEALVRQQVDKVIQDYLKLADETDLDVLNSSIETLVETYSEELVPVATQLTTRLAESYLRLLRENIAQEAGLDAEMDPSAITGDDDKTFAAMGVTKTIATIISSLGSKKEILAQIQEIVIPIVMFTLDNKQIDLFDNIYELVDSLTFNMRRIDQNMWPVLESTYKLFKSDAVDFLDEMLPSLDNFLSYGADVIKATPNFKMMLLDIYTTAMTSDQLGENDRVNASKLIESFLLNLRGEVDDAIPIIVPIAVKQLDEANSRALRLANLETLINVVLYNAAAALQCMETHEAGASRKFFDKWFTALKSEHGFPRVHDKKLSIMAMSALLEIDPAAVPPTLQEGWAGIVSATLHVFRTLPVAIERRKALEDAFEGGDDDDEDDDSEPVALELNDEEGDVWDEDSSYLEYLANEGVRLRNKAANIQNGIDDDDEDDDSDDESDIDEELGFISPLDSVDPYAAFKQALTAFQMKNPAAYQAATTSLDVEQQTLLMEVMTIAEKNSTAAPAA